MEREPSIIRPADRPEAINVIGTSVTVLADNEGTGGLGFTVQHGSEGSGPGAHFHPWEEAFFVLDGSVEFTIDGNTSVLEPGSLVIVPRETVHAFRYGPGGGRMIEVTGPGSAAAGMFRTFAAEMPGEPDLAQSVDIMARHGATLVV